jgi:hypothetical protein
MADVNTTDVNTNFQIYKYNLYTVDYVAVFAWVIWITSGPRDWAQTTVSDVIVINTVTSTASFLAPLAVRISLLGD